MKASRAWWLWFVAALVLAVFTGACGDDDDDDDDDNDDSGDDDDSAEDPVEEGKRWLQAGEPDRARIAFRRAMEEQPENPDAYYGMMLASDLHLWQLVSLISAMIADQDSGFGTKSVDDNRDLIRQIIGMLEDQVLDPASDDIDVAAEWLIQNGDPSFELADVPVLLTYQVAALLGPEFDASERVGSLAWSRGFDALGKTLYALEIDTSLDYLLNYDEFLDLDGSFLEILASIVNLLDMLLNDPGFPDFLRIDPDNLESFKETQTEWGVACIGLAALLNSVRAETDMQDDDVIAYQDSNANGVCDAGEPIVIPGVGPLDEEDMALLNALEYSLFYAGAAFLDRTAYDIDPAVDNPLDLAYFNPLLWAFDVNFEIPEGVIALDVAGFYEDVQPDTIRNFLQGLVDLLGSILPDESEAE